MTLYILLGLYLITVAGCAAFQRRMIYYPTTGSPADMEQVGTAQGLQRWKNAAGQNIGWKRSAPTQPPRGAVLITHGNAGCAIHRAGYVEPLRTSEGMDVFILEYPGYGDRSGSHGQKPFFAAADEAFHSLPKTAPVYLVGESLGTGVACYLAGKYSNHVAGVLLFAPYNSLVDVAQNHVVILPASLILKDRFESEKHLKSYHGPVALLVGGRDRVIPEKFGRHLFDGYHGPKRLWQIPNAGHNDIVDGCREHWGEVISFWRTHGPAARR